MKSSNSPLAQVPSHFDVLVVGAGAAGLYAALCLPNHLRVGLITKDTLKTGASDWAQGGVAAAIAPLDSPELHLQDTIKAGAGLCDLKAVKFLVENAAVAIASLVQMGVAFDRQGEQLAMTLEAAHSRPRVLHAADTTGRAIVDTLISKVEQRSNIQVLSRALALSLWITPQGCCQGISLLYQGQIHWLGASAVILATGGGGQVFAQTTNPAVSTGDGVALAWRSGAVVRDLEFFQFHPTALTKPGAPHFLISEAVRGEGAHLVDAKGERFAFRYHPSGELAPRDVVSRAIFNHLQANADPAQAPVFLDLRSIEPEKIRRRFPNIIKVCQRWGVDVFNEPIPVAPAAHYWMGGIAVDLDNQTSIEGLFAIGETASTGVHGANRLASNSLLECLVFARNLSQMKVKSFPVPEVAPSTWEAEDWTEQMAKIESVRRELPRLMWQCAGICRSQALLAEAIAKVSSWREELAALRISQYVLAPVPAQTVNLKQTEAEEHLRTAAQTLNLVDVAYLILNSAAFRTESRGGHYRADYPQSLPNWQVHTLIQNDSWQTSSIDT